MEIPSEPTPKERAARMAIAKQREKRGTPLHDLDRVLLAWARLKKAFVACGGQAELKRRKRAAFLERYWADEKNKERHKAVVQRYFAENRDRFREMRRERRAANPERTRAEARNYSHIRRQRERAGATATHAEVEALREKVGKRCAICKCRGQMTIDHIIPLSKGGRHELRNIQFLCGPCNFRKSDRDPIEFAQAQGLLV